MNQVLVVIVDKGQDKKVIELAKLQGAPGGTVMRGKGASAFLKKDFLGFDIEVEKDVILIVSKESNIKQIMNSLNEEFKFSQPNSGIAFVLNTKSVLGIVNDG